MKKAFSCISWVVASLVEMKNITVTNHTFATETGISDISCLH